MDSYQEYVASLKTAIADRTRELSDWAKQTSTDVSVALTQAQADLTKLQQDLEAQKGEQQQINARQRSCRRLLPRQRKIIRIPQIWKDK